jgi:hypothetical protein
MRLPVPTHGFPLAVLAAVLFFVAAPAAAADSRGALLAQTYSGLGSWIDIFDDAAWEDPEAAVRAMDRKGATILFLQSASSRPGPAVFRPARTARFLRAAHARGITVVAWYLAPYVDRSYETRRAVRAIRFETGDGERYDGFALDIETAADSPPAPVRNRRLLAMSERLREVAGPLYPLGAIIPSPGGPTSPTGRSTASTTPSCRWATTRTTRRRRGAHTSTRAAISACCARRPATRMYRFT